MIEVKPGTVDYDQDCYLALKGEGDLAAGQNLKLSLGETIVVGRSRHCDWSLKRAPAYLKTSGADRVALHKRMQYCSVSRKHVRIAFLAKDMVELKNLSANGTYVDGKRVDRIVLEDCTTREHLIRLGPHGPTLRLSPGSLPL